MMHGENHFPLPRRQLYSYYLDNARCSIKPLPSVTTLTHTQWNTSFHITDVYHYQAWSLNDFFSYLFLVFQSSKAAAEAEGAVVRCVTDTVILACLILCYVILPYLILFYLILSFNTSYFHFLRILLRLI